MTRAKPGPLGDALGRRCSTMVVCATMCVCGGAASLLVRRRPAFAVAGFAPQDQLSLQLSVNCPRIISSDYNNLSQLSLLSYCPYVFFSIITSDSSSVVRVVI
jgi:hypothetical protein